MINSLRPSGRVRGGLLHAATVAVVGSGLLVPAIPALATQGVPADLLIRNGQVIDGTGAAARSADVALTGDRITFVGDAARANVQAKRTLDARGLIVAPGFIDPHTHTRSRTCRATTRSGVRTSTI